MREKPAGKRSKPGAAPKLWTFPKNSLEDAIKIPKAIEEKNAGNPMKADVLAKAVGFRQPQDWRFLDLLRSANQYGLVSGSGANATVSLEKIGQDVVAPSSPAQRQQALVRAFRHVDEFKRVEDFYRGKRIPEGDTLKECGNNERRRCNLSLIPKPGTAPTKGEHRHEAADHNRPAAVKGLL